jgi:hypothetical protein
MMTTTAQKVLGTASKMTSYSPVSFEGLKFGACNLLDQIILKAKSRSLFSIATLFCSAVGDGLIEKKAMDVFDYVDPLIGTIDGGMSGYCLCMQVLT